MSDWVALLWLVAILAVIFLMDGLAMLVVHAEERHHEAVLVERDLARHAAAARRATERRAAAARDGEAAAVRQAGGVCDPQAPPPATLSPGGRGCAIPAVAPAGFRLSLQQSFPSSSRRVRVVGLPSPSDMSAVPAGSPAARAVPVGAAVLYRPAAAPTGSREAS